jgi:signal transduction histidine kinase
VSTSRNSLRPAFAALCKIFDTRSFRITFSINTLPTIAAFSLLSIGSDYLIEVLAPVCIIFCVLTFAFVAARRTRGRAPGETDRIPDLISKFRRDMHDGLGPTITSALMRIETARRIIKRDPHAADEMLAQAHAEMQDVLAQMRELAFTLRPRCAPAERPLRQCLQELGARLEQASGRRIRVRFDCPPELPRMRPGIGTALYLIAGEALTNVAKHSQATECTIRLGVAEPGIVFQVTDNGVGLPADSLPAVGISSMRARAAELGGHCLVSTCPSGKGTEVRVFLPYKPCAGNVTGKGQDQNDIYELLSE